VTRRLPRASARASIGQRPDSSSRSKAGVSHAENQAISAPTCLKNGCRVDARQTPKRAQWRRRSELGQVVSPAITAGRPKADWSDQRALDEKSSGHFRTKRAPNRTRSTKARGQAVGSPVLVAAACLGGSSTDSKGRSARQSVHWESSRVQHVLLRGAEWLPRSRARSHGCLPLNTRLVLAAD